MKAMEENYELAKWLAGEMTEKELKAFQQTPEYATYVKIAEYSSQLKTPDFDADLMYKNIINHKKATPKVIPIYQKKWIKIAAIFLVFLGISFLFKTTATTTQIAVNGKRTSFVLPDDSQVVLNSGSEIHYKKWNWDSNRNIDLNGEAYFKVAHGKKFEVKTNIGKVTVLGTQFNVKARNNRFDVTCYEGKVKVVYKKQTVIITKGISVSFDTNYFEKENVVSIKPEWTSNEIVFKKEKLENIVSELERQYNCKIKLIQNNNNQLFTGTLPANDIKTAINIISSSYHLKISKFDTREIILEDF